MPAVSFIGVLVCPPLDILQITLREMDVLPSYRINDASDKMRVEDRFCLVGICGSLLVPVEDNHTLYG